MADEQRQASTPGGPRPSGHGPGGHGPGGGHGGPRREGGPGGGPGGPRRGKRQYFRKKKVCKFCVEKMDFADYKRADVPVAVRPGTRQDSAAPHDRRLRASSALGSAKRSSARATSRCFRSLAVPQVRRLLVRRALTARLAQAAAAPLARMHRPRPQLRIRKR